MSYIEGMSPGWMSTYNIEALQKIAISMKRTDFSVLDIGSFLGRSTLQWFFPYKQALISGKQASPPHIMCIDTFDYSYIPPAARKELNLNGYNVDWEGNMLNDFMNNLKEFLPHIEIVKTKYPYTYRIDPQQKFDIIFIDASLIGTTIKDILKAVKLHCSQYRTLICGPHYSDYAPEIVQEVNDFCNSVRGRFETFTSSNIWSIKLQGN